MLLSFDFIIAKKKLKTFLFLYNFSATKVRRQLPKRPDEKNIIDEPV